MKILIADFETTPFDYNQIDNYELKSRFICFINAINNERLFLNLESDNKEKKLKDYILSLCSIKEPTRIYFHNLRFDLAFLYDLLPKEKEYKYNVIKSGSKIIEFKIYKEYKRKDKFGKERIERKTYLDVRDTLVLFLSSVEDLGKAIGIQKLEQDYFQKNITKEYVEYCYRDIEIVQKFMFKLLDVCKECYNFELKIENLPLTLPSLAKKLFHKLLVNRFGNNILSDLYDISDKQNDLFREFYYGGRVEVFNFNYIEKAYYNDFNSHYPSIMKENSFPIPQYKIFKCIDSEKCFNQWKNNTLIFGCFCEIIENQDIPLIASKIKDKLIFGNGLKRCFLFRKEIEYLLELKQKVIIKSFCTCSKYLPIFQEYVDISYKIKKESNDNAIILIAKYLMNQLYGKFAEKKDKERIDIINDLTDLTEIELRETTTSEKGFIRKTIQNHSTLKNNVVISMMITSLARLKLHQYILKENNCYYTDTDSIVSEKEIENSKELGNMNVKMILNKFQPLGCKEYVYESNNLESNNLDVAIKLKGFGNLKQTNKSLFDKFENIIVNYEKPIKQNRLIGFFESFVRDLSFTTMLVYDKYKTSFYDKRFINSDLTTKPFHLQNDNFDLLIENNEKMLEQIINSYKNN